MNKATADQLIALLASLFKHSREHAARFRALEQIAQEHPEIFADFEDRVSQIERNAVFQKSHDRTLEAVDKLRTELLRE